MARTSPSLAAPAEQHSASFWRGNPLAAPGARFFISPYVELVYGRIVQAGHRTDTVPGLLHYAATFANDEQTQFLPRMAPQPVDEAKLAAIRPDLEPERLAARRQEMRTLLRAAVHGSSAPDEPDFVTQPDEFLHVINERAAGNIEWTISLDRGVGWRLVGVVNECEGFAAVVTSLLLNEKHRELLGQCGNAECGRFFIVERAEGKPRTVYCCEDCMLAVNAEGSAARQRDRYKRRRAGEMVIEGWRGRPPSEAIKLAVKQAFKQHPDATAEQLAAHARVILKSERAKK